MATTCCVKTLDVAMCSSAVSDMSLVQEEAAKAGDVMDLYRQMLEGGGGGGGSGVSGSSGGAGESPDRCVLSACNLA